MTGKHNCNYIFYADESGDHSLKSTDPNYPLFVLSICGFKKSVYCNKIVPKFQNFKFEQFGHDAIVLHEREIRKQVGAFSQLANPSVRLKFMDELSKLVASSRFKVFVSIINKPALNLDLFPQNPYVLALRECLESCFLYLCKLKEENSKTYFILLNILFLSSVFILTFDILTFLLLI